MAAMCRAGHLHNHRTNALDGSQDDLGGGEAHQQWIRIGMAEVRAETMRRVDSEIALAGEARWDLTKGLLQEYPRRKCMDNCPPEMEIGADPASPGASRE
eukprot:7871943-Alexandrium_andersonii.AAC.1